MDSSAVELQIHHRLVIGKQVLASLFGAGYLIQTQGERGYILSWSSDVSGKVMLKIALWVNEADNLEFEVLTGEIADIINLEIIKAKV